MNAPAIRLEHRQHQTLTPRMQRAVRLLQLSSLDFAQEVRQVLGKNPFLEADDSFESDIGADGNTARPRDLGPPAQRDDVAEVLTSPMPVACESLPQPIPIAEPDIDAGWARDNWVRRIDSHRHADHGGDTSAIDLKPADISLAQHLHGQINLLPLSLRDRLLAGCVIESLDDDGYLRTNLSELAHWTGLSPTVDEAEMRVALKLVQSLEPAGVGARTVSECLLLQLPTIENPAQRQLAGEIIGHHLERLARQDLSGLAKTMHCRLRDVEAAAARIRRMDPRPGWRHGNADIQFVTPDVIVKKHKGTWLATLNAAIVPRVRLNQMYANLFQRHRDCRHAELATHLQEARWTVRNVEQRFSTILSVADAILKRQGRFLEFGALAMKPMGLREIADELGLHESTVSRVTNNKYMATPCGVFELKFFFSRAMPTSNGGACSPTAIRGVIKEMIKAELPTHPLSDAEIARQLARQGLAVARRTVTKYRQLMKLPAVEQRRQHA